jgi:glycerol-3-phosphate acyltransferase PlsX
MIIAVDGMGGDKAPSVIVEGAILAAKEYSGLQIILVGMKDTLETELVKYKPQSNILIQAASEVVGMDEPPAASVRRKRDSSICVGFELVKSKHADGFVTAGNTGAAVCAATLILGLLNGIERPGIAIIIPTLKGTSILIDAGANIDPKPIHLLQYGIMGDAYARYILKKENPSVGLLNIGEEESKGTEFMKETHRLLNESKLNFMGNIEGRQIFTGDCDCIVSDGFVGNVALKVSESFAEAIDELLRRELKRSFLTRLGAALSHSAFSMLKEELDYSEYGGAPLLGVDGICIISHGRSSAKAIKNAIRVAAESVAQDVNGCIIKAMA